MFEKFSERATKSIVLAKEEAVRLGHDYVGTEHLLLGLLCETTGAAAKALKCSGVTLKEARGIVEELTGRGDNSDPAQMPFTARAKRVLELSYAAHKQSKQKHIGTAQILIGIIDEGSGRAVEVLKKLMVNLPKLRADLLSSAETEKGKPPDDLTYAPPGLGFTNTREAIERGDEFYKAGKFADAEPLYLLAMVLLVRKYEEDHEEVLSCMAKLGDAFIGSQKWKDAGPVFRRLAGIRAKVGIEDGSSFYKLARVYDSLSDFQNAATNYQRAIALAEMHLQKSELADILDSYAASLTRNGRSQAAQLMSQRAAQLRENL